MSLPPSGAASALPLPASAGGIVRSAIRIAVRHPRQAMLPIAVVQVPVSTLAAVATALLYLVFYPDEPIARGGTELPAGGVPLFAALAITLGEALFAQVARGGAIVSIAALVRGRPVGTAQALDPAFTRMGALLLLVAIMVAGTLVAVVSIAGIILLPYLAIRFLLSFEAFMLEPAGAWSALGRSWRLTRGKVLRLLAMALLALLVLVGPLVAVSMLGLAVTGSRTQRAIAYSLYTFAQGVLLIPLVAFMTATTTLAYLTIKEARDE